MSSFCFICCAECGKKLHNTFFCPECGQPSCSLNCYRRHEAQHDEDTHRGRSYPGANISTTPFQRIQVRQLA